MLIGNGWEISGAVGASLVVACGFLAACEVKSDQVDLDVAEAAPKPVVVTPILVDGSSTVHLLSEAILDLYASHLTTDIKLEVSGTGGGFKKFCTKTTHINGASRPITAPESKLCEENGVQYVELPVAYDGIALVVPKANDWLESITVAELARIWSAQSENMVHSWRQVNPKYPEQAVHLYGPGLESGTFDFFNEAILGKEAHSRGDYKSSENDHELASLIADDAGGLGYFGLAYYRKYQDRLRLVALDDGNGDNGSGAILPSPETVGSGQYAPLSRPLFLYIAKRDLERPEVSAFVQFYLKSARLVAPDVGYIGLGREVLHLASARLAQRKVGSVFSGVHSVVGLTIADLLQAEEDAVAAPGANPLAENRKQ